MKIAIVRDNRDLNFQANIFLKLHFYEDTSQLMKYCIFMRIHINS